MFISLIVTGFLLDQKEADRVVYWLGSDSSRVDAFASTEAAKIAAAQTKLVRWVRFLKDSMFGGDW
jgi:hypothetical protein